MAYYEYLRVRHAFLIFAAIVIGLAVTVYAVAEYHSASAVIKIEVDGHHTHDISVVIFTSIAAFATAILASITSTSFNRLRGHLAYAWTRPQSRISMALSLIGVDLAVLLCGFTLVLGVEIACFLLISHGAIGVRWNGAAADVLRALGFAIMWYAIVQGVSARLQFSGGAIVGISWPVFMIGASLEGARFPAPWHEILTAINLFNPMAYLSGTHVSANGDVVLQSFIGFDPAVRVALMYGISLLALSVAVTTWRRMEA